MVPEGDEMMGAKGSLYIARGSGGRRGGGSYLGVLLETGVGWAEERPADCSYPLHLDELVCGRVGGLRAVVPTACANYVS